MDNQFPSNRRRSRKEWREELRRWGRSVRSWIQSYPERAAIVTGLLGFMIAIFFKLFVFLAVLGLITGYVVWFLAVPD